MTTKMIFATAALGACLVASPIYAAGEGMPSMPLIKPKRTIVVSGAAAGEELRDQRGFGDQEPMVRMMNLMMVEGSGYEGMDMSRMTMASASTAVGHGHEGHMAPAAAPSKEQPATYDLKAKITPDPPKVGTNVLEVQALAKDGQKPMPGLRLKAQVYMTSMDMGTEEPKVKEVSPGTYQVKAVFSMMGPWAVKLMLPEGGEKVFSFDVGGQ